MVDDALAVQAVRNPCPLEQLDSALFEHTGANARLDVLAAPVLEHDSLDPRLVKELRERQARGAGADDRDVRALARHDSSSTCWATAKARFAAGTPQ